MTRPKEQDEQKDNNNQKEKKKKKNEEEQQEQEERYEYSLTQCPSARLSGATRGSSGGKGTWNPLYSLCIWWALKPIEVYPSTRPQLVGDGDNNMIMMIIQ